jgi:hypothetical protein
MNTIVRRVKRGEFSVDGQLYSSPELNPFHGQLIQVEVPERELPPELTVFAEVHGELRQVCSAQKISTVRGQFFPRTIPGHSSAETSILQPLSSAIPVRRHPERSAGAHHSPRLINMIRTGDSSYTAQK